MAEDKSIKPDYVFEVSWEVCNKVGGIHTVISTKALTLVEQFQDKAIMIGPDVWKGTGEHPEFEEDKSLFTSWKAQTEKEGLKVKIGRWKIAGRPIVILVNFAHLFTHKNEIFTELWLKYKVDSLTGQWDYIEPAIFGYAVGKIIECFYHHHLTFSDKIIAQFHEWMTGTGLLYLHEKVPQIGAVFTTHATVAGRSIAGNGLPLYSKFDTFNAEQIAKDYNFISKQSLEKITAKNADSFTTVSEITAKECVQFLGKKPDVITPNGFEDSFVPAGNDFERKRSIARKKLIAVASALFNKKISDDTLFVAKSGRYEFRNKGIDLFIDSMAQLNKNNELQRDIIAFILVPAHHTGARKELQERMAEPDYNAPLSNEFLTHNLQGIENDPVMNQLKKDHIQNLPNDKVKVIFASTYLNGDDGIFDLSYYDLLIGFDVSAFPSYYEPWGYTPLESLAFHIPTVTTNRTGFGMTVNATIDEQHEGILVIERNDDNEADVTKDISEFVLAYTKKSAEEVATARESAFQLSRMALWKNLFMHYQKAYSIALQKAKGRELLFTHKPLTERYEKARGEVWLPPQPNEPSWRKIFIQSELPENLEGLQRLSKNLWWSWNYEATALFRDIDHELWISSNENPVVFLKSLSYMQLRRLEKDKDFLKKLNTIEDAFNKYMEAEKDKKSPQIAYFCMEYGLTSFIHLYSGGLGILAGDFLKEASDSNVNMIGVGLLYRNGYFKQDLSIHGEQMANYEPQKFTNLPLVPVRDKDDNWVKINLALPGRVLYAKAWKIDVGRTPLYLLDTDIPENSAEDRMITNQLYGGDWENRLKQEVLLGIGGVRLLDTLGLQPDIFHCNEGHAAFIGIERLCQLVQGENISFTEALEIVKSSTLFTTHTPIAAGNDMFTEELLRAYLSHHAHILNINWQDLISLGKADEFDQNEKFSMNFLAARLAQEVNGVSKIHGEVSRKIFNVLWRGFSASELHIGYVTNGVHYGSWTAQPWRQLYEKEFADGFPEKQSDLANWAKIQQTPDKTIWDTHVNLKKELIRRVREKLRRDLTERHESPQKIFRKINALNEKALTIGFARRFITYKRADLIFLDMQKLAKLIGNSERPVQIFFAGKAHPMDKPGQDLIKHIVHISEMPDFEGKVFFLENYDMELARHLVNGVDLWLNTPKRPLEASGTSGMKATLNGVLNLSVLDGWWAEAYDEKAGWAIEKEKTYDRQDYQDELDAETIYSLLEDEIIPLYFDRNKDGIPEKWIAKVKNAIAIIAPAFTTRRMMADYYRLYYQKLYYRSQEIRNNHFEMARGLAAWKRKIRDSWDEIEVVDMEVYDSENKPLPLGEDFKARIGIFLDNLSVDDLGIEILFIRKRDVDDKDKDIVFSRELTVTEVKNKQAYYECKIPMTWSGVYEFSFRIFPKNALLPYRHDFNLIKWI